MEKNRIIGWCGIVVLLTFAIYCAYMFKNSFVNALFDVLLAFSAFYVGQKESSKEIVQLRAVQLEQQAEIEKLKSLVDVLNNNGSNKPKPSSNVIWEHAIKR